MWIQVGERISQLRKDRNMSRAQLGKIVGLSGQYIGKIEKGTHRISGETIAKICNEMGISADYLLFGIINPSDSIAAINGLSQEQINIALDIIKRVAQFINSHNGNNALIKEVLCQQNLVDVPNN